MGWVASQKSSPRRSGLHSDKLTTFSVAQGKHKTRHHPDRGTQKGRELGWGVDVSDPYLYHDEPLRRHGFFKAWI
jgi:hypothetical protein